jgi:hypothetical protein
LVKAPPHPKLCYFHQGELSFGGFDFFVVRILLSKSVLMYPYVVGTISLESVVFFGHLVGIELMDQLSRHTAHVWAPPFLVKAPPHPKLCYFYQGGLSF